MAARKHTTYNRPSIASQARTNGAHPLNIQHLILQLTAKGAARKTIKRLEKQMSEIFKLHTNAFSPVARWEEVTLINRSSNIQFKQ